MSAFLHSFLVALAATAMAVGLGGAVALVAAASERRGRIFWLGLAAATLVMPPFLIANCWLELTQGIRSAWLPERAATAGLPITALVLGLMLWPIPAFAAAAAWHSLPAALVEVEVHLRGHRLLHDLLWPAARPALVRAAAIVAILALTNFSVPVLFQVHVLPELVWIRFNTQFDTTGALSAAGPMIAAGAALWLALRRSEPAWPRFGGSVGTGLLGERLGPAWRWTTLALSAAAVAVSLGLPLFRLVGEPRTWAELPGAIAAGLPAMANSVLTSALAATAVVGAGLLLAGALGGRVRGPGPLWLAFLVPGVALSIGWIHLLSLPGLRHVADSPAVLVLALGLRYLAPAWAGLAAAIRAADPDLVDAARLAGGRHVAFRTGLWPQVRGPVAAVWSVAYLLCLWDVESVILVVPPGGETLAMRIFNLLHYGHATQVNALCVVLLAVAIVPPAAMALFAVSRPSVP